MNNITIHRAPWVVPVSHPAIPDGAVAVQNKRILNVGGYNDLITRHPGSIVKEHAGSVLLPPLVNAHIHLELSHICIPKLHKTVTGFTSWINKLLDTRERYGAIGDLAEKAARDTLMQQYGHGVVALGDIGNTDFIEQFTNDFPGSMLHFNEVLGRSSKSRRSILERVAQAEKTKMFTAHAPYSTHAELIKALKQRARTLGHPFPIHVAESQSESELLNHGSGELYEFLIQRGFIDKSFEPPAAIDNPGSVQYLNTLGVLDKQTICVHCIHVSSEEIEILAETKTNVCLCPGSNRYLNVGRAPVKQFLDHDLLPALGTDSTASNPELSIWREMRLLKEDHPEVRASDIFSMATSGGAAVLGLDKDYGTLEKGKKAQLLAVMLPGEIQNPDVLFDILVTDNKGIKPVWV